MAGSGLTMAALSGTGSFWGIAIPLFVFVTSIGMVMPIASALAMASQRRAAGSASALIGTLQFGGGALTGALVGALYNSAAVPIAVVMGLAGLAGLLSRLILVR
jgi:DHA1 family bicyclomycin/chloramphenicol resistance-like MFS transporter